MGPEAVFRAHLRAGRLRIQFCCSCDKGVHYPRVLCPYCGATNLEFREIRREGTVYSTTVEHRFASDPGLFNLALIDMDAGVRILSQVEGCAPESVHIGQRVKAVIGQREDLPIILFEPLDAQAA